MQRRQAQMHSSASVPCGNSFRLVFSRLLFCFSPLRSHNVSPLLFSLSSQVPPFVRLRLGIPETHGSSSSADSALPLDPSTEKDGGWKFFLNDSGEPIMLAPGIDVEAALTESGKKEDSAMFFERVSQWERLAELLRLRSVTALLFSISFFSHLLFSHLLFRVVQT